MALSSRMKNKIVDTMNTVFASIGNANGMRMPKSEDNRESLAWDFHIAKHVLSLAEKRKARAEEALVKAGILPDKEKNPLPAGTREIVFTGDSVSLMVEVRNAGPRVNAEKLLEYLRDHGVKQALLDEAAEQATTYPRPPHMFSAMWVTSD